MPDPTREQMIEAEFEAWWDAMPPDTANAVAVCGEQVRAGLKEAIKFGWMAAAERMSLNPPPSAAKEE